MSNFPFWALVLFCSPLFAQDVLETSKVVGSGQIDPLMALLASGGSTPLGLVLAALVLRGFQPRIHVVIEEDQRDAKK